MMVLMGMQSIVLMISPLRCELALTCCIVPTTAPIAVPSPLATSDAELARC